jgi:hypothetical protein
MSNETVWASCKQDETLEETGWKLVHGDVFRPPRFPMLLVSLVGSGIQLFAATFIVIGAFELVAVSANFNAVVHYRIVYAV